METITKCASSLYNLLPVREIETVIKEIEVPMSLTNVAGRNFVRIGGVSGGLAVMMSAYGAHAFNQKTDDEKIKNVFESGNKMHLIHSVALLGVPLTRRPILVGSMMTAGMVLFCGTCYYQAITGDSRVRKATPYGGMLLILSWFMMII